MSKQITKADRKRFRRLRRHGCIACKKLGIYQIPEIHHLTDGYRLGHSATIPLCCWHHRGSPWYIHLRPSQMTHMVGDSLATNKCRFVEQFGSEQELLQEIDLWLSTGKEVEQKDNAVNGSSLPF